MQITLTLLVDGSDGYVVSCSRLRKSSLDRRFKVSMEKASEVGPVKDVLGFSGLGMFGLLEIEGALGAGVIPRPHHVTHFECVLKRRVRSDVLLTDHVCVHARLVLQRVIADWLFFLSQ